MLRGLPTPHIANPKRRKLSEPDSRTSKSKPMAGSVDKARNDAGIKMVGCASRNSGEPDATRAHEPPGISKQASTGANGASKIAVTAMKDDPGQIFPLTPGVLSH